jgi:hypothetical protein
MDVSTENSDTEFLGVENRLRLEILLLHPWHRKHFDFAVFDSKTNSLHGAKYSLYYCEGRVSIH